jgi:hypothetical protein
MDDYCYIVGAYDQSPDVSLASSMRIAKATVSTTWCNANSTIEFIQDKHDEALTIFEINGKAEGFIRRQVIHSQADHL